MIKIDKHKDFILKEQVLVKIGDFILTKSDLDTKYREKISKHFGEYTDRTIDKALYTLHDIEDLYNKGGYIYRVIWLEKGVKLDVNNLGDHWLSNEGDIDNIVNLFSRRDGLKGEPHYIKAYTPPKNVIIPYDYFSNLEENEVLVVNSRILTEVETFKV